MCVLRFQTPSDAFSLVPADKENGKKSCQHYLNDQNVESCGLYRNKFFMCVQYLKLILNDTTAIKDINLDGYSTIDPNWACPFNYFKIDFDKYERPSSDPKFPMYINGDLTAIYSNDFDKVSKDNKYYKEILEKKDKNFFYDLDTAVLGNYLPMQNATQSFADFLPDQLTFYAVGQNFGFKDELNGPLDKYDFVNMINDTFYVAPPKKFNASNSNYSFLPEFMESDGPMYPKYLYFPVDNFNTTYNVTATLFELTNPVISESCFDNWIKAENDYYFWDNIEALGTEFLEESLPTFIAWSTVQIFISYYWHYKIRYQLINKILLDGELDPADENSEFITKLTSKLTQVIMFMILFFAVIYQGYRFSNGKTILDKLLKFKCYEGPLINQSFEAYKTFLISLELKNNITICSLFISFMLEIIIGVYFIYEYKLYREEMRLEEEILAQIKSQ